MQPVKATIMIGHVIDALRRLPAESVHCVVTSPPYWGLRSYKTPSQVWGGNAECSHRWQPMLKPAANGMVFSEMRDRREGGSLNDASATRKPNWSESCALCDAWRGEHGLEPTITLYLRHVLLWTREVRRVLRPDGVFFLNMGDCYHSGDRGEYQNTRTRHDSLQSSNLASDFVGAPNRMPQAGLKDKDLVQMPARVSLMLQEDGWWCRSKIVWAKGISFIPGYSGSVMPESTGDRPTRAYEEVFLFTKSAQYFLDMDAIREPLAESSLARISQPTFDGQTGGGKDYGASGVNRNRSARKALENLRTHVGRSRMRRDAGREQQGLRTAEKFGHGPGWRDKIVQNPNLAGRRQAPEPGEPNAFHPLGRNVRDVWAINPEPFDYEMCRACKRVYDGREYGMLADAPRDGDAPPKKVCRCGRFDEWLSHFAVFPQALALPCVQAGTSEKGCCQECGAPWERVSEPTGYVNQREQAYVPGNSPTKTDSTGWRATKQATDRWRPTCPHKQATVPCTVFDPFVGSGTTLLVAAENGRHSIGVELQEDYVPLIRKRLAPLETDLVHPLTVLERRFSVEPSGDQADGSQRAGGQLG